MKAPLRARLVPVALLLGPAALGAQSGPPAGTPQNEGSADPPARGADAAPKDERRRPAPMLDLDTLVVTPTRSKESILDVPYTVDYVSQERIEFLRTVPQSLRDIPGVMVQETGTGQGSPYIRGFTGFRTLFLVDGIRLNNSAFREGPNQYAGTIDPLSLRGIEVVKGPSSVLYGPDAIGGTVNVLTKDPRILDRPFGGQLFTRVASGANYNIQRAEFGGRVGRDTFWHLGVTRKDFGNMEAGGDSGTLENTGYDEWDGDLKVLHELDGTSRLTFAVQRVDLEDAPRTHRTVFAVPFANGTVGSELRHDFDQRRTLTYLRYENDGISPGDWSTQITLSHHRQDEVRQRERSGGRFDDQGIDVGTLGLGVQGSRATSLGRLTTGFEYYRDSVDSFLNRFADQTPADFIQGPLADDATYDLAGIYAELAFDVSDSTTITAGARYTYAAADANEVRDPVTASQISIDEEWSELTGSVRFEARLHEGDNGTLALFGGISQGFRAPTLSDLTRFDSARTNEFEIPAPGLDPETYIAYELGLKHESDRASVQLAGFVTQGDEVIQRIRTGNTNGAGEFEVTKQNVGESIIGGVELGASFEWNDEWTTFGTFTWLDGQQDVIETIGDPITDAAPSRLMPLTTMVGTRYSPTGQSWYAELRWIHVEDADRLAPGDERDTSRIPPGGTPGYDIIDLLGRYDINVDASVFFGLENLTDEDYRVHGSGQNRPGRNFVFGARWSF